MFTGLIREIGWIEAIRTGRGIRHITYSAPAIAGSLKTGSSVAVDGVCQTVTALTHKGFSAQALEASLLKTTLGDVKKGSPVNLEPALVVGESLDGHIVQGHVSGTAVILGMKKQGMNRYLRLKLAPELIKNCVSEGSLTVNGISLTIAELRSCEIVINIIPLTWDTTTLQFKHAGDMVNIETDFFLRREEVTARNSALTKERIIKWGY